MGRLKAKSDYEELRKARISENQILARLASLGLQKTISELRSLASSPKSDKTHVRKYCKIDHSSTPLRRSARLTGKSPSSQGKLEYLEDSDSRENGKTKRSVSGHIVRAKRGSVGWDIPPETLARRCDSKGRGSLYNPVYGICCHFCRQKKMCGEEDCKRCGDLDMDQPCIGKTDCSVCHSSNGVLCRGCLKVRYGEEMEEARSNTEWMCPHCIEEKGINPYWIYNSSFCLKKRKMVPTGIAVYRAREMGFKSVAHLLMDELQRADTANHPCVFQFVIRDAERDLVKKLASLRKVEGYTLQSNDAGTHGKDSADRPSSHRNNSEMHWLKSIKNVLWRKQPGERFASVCIDASAPCGYQEPLPNFSSVLSISIIFVSAAVALLMSKPRRCKFWQQKKQLKHDFLPPRR